MTEHNDDSTPCRVCNSSYVGIHRGPLCPGADPEWSVLVSAITEGKTLLAMAYARSIRKRVNLPASEVYKLAQSTIRDQGEPS